MIPLFDCEFSSLRKLVNENKIFEIDILDLLIFLDRFFNFK